MTGVYCLLPMSRWSEILQRLPGRKAGASRAHGGWIEPSNAVTRAILDPARDHSTTTTPDQAPPQASPSAPAAEAQPQGPEQSERHSAA